MDKIVEYFVGWAFVLLGVMAAIGAVVLKFADMGAAHPGGGDIATWMSAVFAGLAFGGTIYIASMESRRRHSEQVVVAKLAAARIKNKIASALGLASGIGTRIQRDMDGEMSGEYFFKLGTKMQILEHWTYQDMVALAPLNDGFAISLAMAQDELIAIMGILLRVSEMSTTANDRRETAEQVITLLNATRSRLEICWHRAIELAPS